MNNLFDIVGAWASKLTYRIMKFSGASEEAREKFLKATTEKNEDIINADRELSGQVQTAKFITVFVIIVGVLLVNRFLINDE